jgi:hypothetical protein
MEHIVARLLIPEALVEVRSHLPDTRGRSAAGMPSLCQDVSSGFTQTVVPSRTIWSVPFPRTEYVPEHSVPEWAIVSEIVIVCPESGTVPARCTLVAAWVSATAFLATSNALSRASGSALVAADVLGVAPATADPDPDPRVPHPAIPTISAMARNAGPT